MLPIGRLLCQACPSEATTTVNGMCQNGSPAGASVNKCCTGDAAEQQTHAPPRRTHARSAGALSTLVWLSQRAACTAYILGQRSHAVRQTQRRTQHKEDSRGAGRAFQVADSASHLGRRRWFRRLAETQGRTLLSHHPRWQWAEAPGLQLPRPARMHARECM